MSNGFIIINEKSWASMSAEEKEEATYNTLKSIDERLKCLEKRKWIDSLGSFAGGVVGGLAAMLGITKAG